MKIKYRFIHNRKKSLNAMGEALVQIEAYQDGKKCYFSTGIYIKPSEWRQCEVVNRHNAMMLNGMLAEQLMKLQRIEVEAWRSGMEPTLQHLRNGYRWKSESPKFIDFVKDMLSTSNHAQSTKCNLLSTARALHSFRPLSLHEIDEPVLADFERYLHTRGNNPNTIAKHFHHLRSILGEAVRLHLVDSGIVTLKCFRRHMEKREHATLSKEEMERMAKVTIFPHVRDAFLFCCHTGLRYSDYTRLGKEHFCKKGDVLWIELRMQKTKQKVSLPITPLTQLLGDMGPHPPIPCNTQTNKQLRRIAEEAGIKKRITFHTARHTFATQLLSKGVPITTVQALLGHSSVRTTQMYAEVKLCTILNDLQRVLR